MKETLTEILIYVSSNQRKDIQYSTESLKLPIYVLFPIESLKENHSKTIGSFQWFSLVPYLDWFLLKLWRYQRKHCIDLVSIIWLSPANVTFKNYVVRLPCQFLDTNKNKYLEGSSQLYILSQSFLRLPMH